MILARKTSLELKNYLKKKKELIIPFGALEAHGPHLPLGNDAYIAQVICRQVGENLSLMVAPTIIYTLARFLEEFIGTMRLQFIPTKNYLQSIFFSFAEMGFEKIFLITHHGNTAHLMAISEAVYELKRQSKTQFIGINLWKILQNIAWKGKITKTKEFHAGEIETSLMLYLQPELVKMDKAIKEKISFNEFLFTDSLVKTKTGVYGDATKASREKGEKLFRAAVKALEKIIAKY